MFFSSCGNSSNSKNASKIESKNKEDEQLKELADSLNLMKNKLDKLKNDSYYKSVRIGNQTWMTENLNVSIFKNGDPILEVKTAEEWERAGENKQPAWCYYDNDRKNGVKYGKLYNWYAVYDPRGLAHTGWHVPTEEEWKILRKHLGEDPGDKMKSAIGWNFDGNGSNESGFSGLPGGVRYENGAFKGIGESGNWWSITDINYHGDRHGWLYYKLPVFWTGSNNTRPCGFSVRCIKD